MIALDTSALIWAVQGATPRKPTYVAQMEAIKNMGGPLLLPAPALAEYLAGLTGADRQEAMTMAGDIFEVAPFDLRAAVFAADLLPLVSKRNKVVTGKAFKIDAMILGAALSRGAKTFLYADGDYLTLAADQPITLVDVKKLKAQAIIPVPDAE